VEYSGELARIQQSAANCADQDARRAQVLGALEPQSGERILDFSCGGGSAAVGAEGQTVGIDIIEDQISVAAERCRGMGNVRLETGDAFALPFDTASFDAVLTNWSQLYLDWRRSKARWRDHDRMGPACGSS